jgi:hypothetical protein
MLCGYTKVTPNIWIAFQPTMQKLLPRQYGRAECNWLYPSVETMLHL